MVAAEAGDLGRLEFEALVVDEGHRLKNKEVRVGGGCVIVCVCVCGGCVVAGGGLGLGPAGL